MIEPSSTVPPVPLILLSNKKTTPAKLATILTMPRRIRFSMSGRREYTPVPRVPDIRSISAFWSRGRIRPQCFEFDSTLRRTILLCLVGGLTPDYTSQNGNPPDSPSLFS